MSYSINQKCQQCAKEVRCADGFIVRKAVETIHNIPSQMHLGGGSVDHNCSNFEDKTTPKPAA
jgi:hypothetical protein